MSTASAFRPYIDSSMICLGLRLQLSDQEIAGGCERSENTACTSPRLAVPSEIEAKNSENHPVCIEEIRKLPFRLFSGVVPEETSSTFSTGPEARSKSWILIFEP